MGKQVKTPRFYVDMPTFLHATGETHWADTDRGGADLLYMNPSNPFTRIDENDILFYIGANSNPKTAFPINFCALLNHNFASETQNIHIGGFKGWDVNDGTHPRLHSANGFENIINSMGNGVYADGLKPEWNGTSIFQFTEMNEYWRGFWVKAQDGIENTDLNHQLGSFVVGKYWDAPNSPDLNLTMSRRFDGIKRQKTIGGKTLANIYYDGPTEWTMNHPDDGTYKYPAFELD